MDPKKLDAIRSWKSPTSVKAIQSFTEFANFYHKFIPNFLNVVAPLNLLTRKNKPWVWMRLQQNAFDTLKQIFSSTPVLLIPDVTCPFTIMTDASLLAARAVLMQTDDNGDHHPCAYFSKTFAPAEWNWYLWPRTPCCHLSSGWVATIPSRHHPSSHCYHRSQKPVLH